VLRRVTFGELRDAAFSNAGRSASRSGAWFNLGLGMCEVDGNLGSLQQADTTCRAGRRVDRAQQCGAACDKRCLARAVGAISPTASSIASLRATVVSSSSTLNASRPGKSGMSLLRHSRLALAKGAQLPIQESLRVSARSEERVSEQAGRTGEAHHPGD
jgi:hypothetical protein